MDLPGYDHWKTTPPDDDEGCPCGEEPRNVYCCGKWWGDKCFEAHHADAHPDERDADCDSDADRGEDEPDYMDQPERGE